MKHEPRNPRAHEIMCKLEAWSLKMLTRVVIAITLVFLVALAFALADVPRARP